jgi:glycerol-3-phosphate dehydrogenase (NAD(P)+)
VLVLSKGLVPSPASLPSEYVSRRVNARAVAALGGPFHAGEAVESGAHAVLASGDDDFRGQLADVLERAGIDVLRTRDLVGVELAGCAKNAAALAARSSPSSSAWGSGAARVARHSPAPRGWATCWPPRWLRTAATGARASCWSRA